MSNIQKTFIHGLVTLFFSERYYFFFFILQYLNVSKRRNGNASYIRRKSSSRYKKSNGVTFVALPPETVTSNYLTQRVFNIIYSNRGIVLRLGHGSNCGHRDISAGQHSDSKQQQRHLLGRARARRRRTGRRRRDAPCTSFARAQ